MVVLSNFLTPQEGIRHEEQNTTVYINDREVGKGTFYITESVLSWVNSDTQQGFSLEYPHISLHAISRDEQVHPRQCLYVMVDGKVDLPDMPLLLSPDNSSENEDDDEDTPITEMRFAPDNTNNLELMFQAMNACQALHPDPQDSFSDEDIYEDAAEDYGEYSEEVGAGDAPYILPTEQIGTSHNGSEAEEAMDVEAGQFEDAEEDP
ncbi:methylosome subunit pICln [Harpegnathos saltator]|uniref:Methylosome subunit pICln n=1 Tax=Harpegnathos saltator TaxID=610380 RepID=E2BUH9_HARSA|nr:methylosome subunit pICln [Harpegnathos saltator]XP_011145320.1 methylosome subunit pICln [Harpegnathos saltator]EFN80649.1 Methylosome subunit pICln [Harpegnathos saltator]